VRRRTSRPAVAASAARRPAAAITATTGMPLTGAGLAALLGGGPVVPFAPVVDGVVGVAVPEGLAVLVGALVEAVAGVLVDGLVEVLADALVGGAVTANPVPLTVTLEPAVPAWGSNVIAGAATGSGRACSRATPCCGGVVPGSPVGTIKLNGALAQRAGLVSVQAAIVMAHSRPPSDRLQKSGGRSVGTLNVPVRFPTPSTLQVCAVIDTFALVIEQPVGTDDAKLGIGRLIEAARNKTAAAIKAGTHGECRRHEVTRLAPLAPPECVSP
jgi:hypothetical protein